MNTKNTGTKRYGFVRWIFPLISAVSLIICVFTSDIMAKAATGEADKGILKREINEQQNLVSIRLVGVAQYEVAEIFNDLLTSIPGVVEAERNLLRIDPEKPQACVVVWQVRVEDTDLFQLESSLYRMIRAVAEDGPDVVTAEFTFAPTEEELELLKQIIPWRASSKELEFVLYRTSTPAPKCFGEDCDSRGTWHHWPDSGFE
jgi:hypothetical protein